MFVSYLTNNSKIFHLCIVLPNFYLIINKPVTLSTNFFIFNFKFVAGLYKENYFGISLKNRFFKLYYSKMKHLKYKIIKKWT